MLLLVSCPAVVPAGYYLKTPGQAAACPKGEYKAGIGAAGACDKCPVAGVTTEKEASESPDACKGGRLCSEKTKPLNGSAAEGEPKG